MPCGPGDISQCHLPLPVGPHGAPEQRASGAGAHPAPAGPRGPWGCAALRMLQSLCVPGSRYTQAPAPWPSAELPERAPSTPESRAQMKPKALLAQSSQNPAVCPEGAQPPQHPPTAAWPTALTATGAAITAALSGAFKNTPGSNLQLRAQACECPRPRRAHQPPASSRTGCKGIPLLGAGFVKPGFLNPRRWLLAASGVLQVVSFTSFPRGLES